MVSGKKKIDEKKQEMNPFEMELPEVKNKGQEVNPFEMELPEVENKEQSIFEMELPEVGAENIFDMDLENPKVLDKPEVMDRLKGKKKDEEEEYVL